MVVRYEGTTTEQYLEFYKDKPQEILIETVGPCNLRCLGCPQAQKSYRELKSKPPFMEFQLYNRILKQTVEMWDPINVGLYHTGEITLLPDELFLPYIATAKWHMPDEKGWDSVGFYTNGLLLNEFKRRVIIENKINWVRLSFDGGDKESYEKVRVGSDFDKVYNNAMALAREAKEAGHEIRLEVIFVPYSENEESIRKFHQLWRDTGWSAGTGGTMNYGGLTEDQVKGRRHHLQRRVRARHSIPCPRVFEQFTVLVDGRVSLCSADPSGKFILGDLREQSIEEVWNECMRIYALDLHRKGHADRISPCKECDYTEYCGRPNGEYFGERL